MIKSILVPTDGSVNSNIALKYAVYIAQKFNARLTGINIVDIRLLQGPMINDLSTGLGLIPDQTFYQKIQEVFDERMKTILKDLEETCLKEAIEVKTKGLTGIIPNIIAEEGKKADIIIMAQRGEHAEWSSGLLGSTTESVVRKSSRPVLVTPDDFHPIENILIPFDAGSESSKALKVAAELTASLNTRLDILSVTDDAEIGKTVLEEAEEFISPYKIKVGYKNLAGDVAKEILRYAGENKSDLIIMGAFGHSRIHELILGGTTSYVLRNTSLPVLLVR